MKRYVGTKLASRPYPPVRVKVIGHPLYVGGETIAFALPGHIIMIGLPISMIVGWRLKNA